MSEDFLAVPPHDAAARVVDDVGDFRTDSASSHRTIRPRRRPGLESLSSVWRHRQLLYFFVWRDVRIRYKQTVLGASWAIVKPLVGTLIFAVIFGHFVHVPSDGVPYWLFVLAGLVPWTYFSSAIFQTTSSLVENANLISKVAFPRVILPVAALLTGTFELVLTLFVLLVVAIATGHTPRATTLLAPLFLLVGVITAAAIGIWLSALNARFRDIGNIVPFLAQVWMYATPIVYPLSLVRGKTALVLALNPMTGVVEGFRWSLFGQAGPNGGSFAVSGAVTVCLLVSGFVYFTRVEKLLADIV